MNGNGGGVASDTYTTIVSSAFTDNAALSGSGGGVWASGSTNSVINTICQGNIADGTGDDGRGGGAFIDGIDSVVVNSTFAENTAREVGGLHASGAVENCILYFNESDQLQTCPFAPTTVPYSDQISWEASPTKSCIQNWVWTGQWPCGLIGMPPDPLNIASDPQFRNLALGNLRLQGDSPCIDNGLDSFVPNDEEDVDENPGTTGPTPDRDLNVRIQDGGLALEVDMGAYEYTPQSDCPTDFNGDDTVDGFDLAILLGAWGTCDSCLADLNENGLVDGFDLALLLGAWGPCSESFTGGGGGESSSAAESSDEDQCGGGIDLFRQWLESGDIAAFMQWLDCTLGLGGDGGSTQ